jgi:hypothetical protein
MKGDRQRRFLLNRWWQASWQGSRNDGPPVADTNMAQLRSSPSAFTLHEDQVRVATLDAKGLEHAVPITLHDDFPAFDVHERAQASPPAPADFKSEKPIAQLMVYALALSRRTGLRIFDFVCAWFDEHDYYEFYPLHVVHKRRNQSPHASPVRTSVK